VDTLAPLAPPARAGVARSASGTVLCERSFHLQTHLHAVAYKLHPTRLIQFQLVLSLDGLCGDDRQQFKLPPSRFPRLFQVAP
jgi:hypothetical protein